MKSIGSKALLARVGLTAAFALGALLGATAASAGIATTKHNLSTGGTGTVLATKGKEVTVPAGTAVSVLLQDPLTVQVQIK